MGVSKDKRFPNMRLGYCFFLRDTQKIRNARKLRDEKKTMVKVFSFGEFESRGSWIKKMVFQCLNQALRKKTENRKSDNFLFYRTYSFLPCICIISLISFFQNYLCQSESGPELIGANQRPFFENEIKNVKLHFFLVKAPKKYFFSSPWDFSICLRMAKPCNNASRWHSFRMVMEYVVFRSNFDWHK